MYLTLSSCFLVSRVPYSYQLFLCGSCTLISPAVPCFSCFLIPPTVSCTGSPCDLCTILSVAVFLAQVPYSHQLFPCCSYTLNHNDDTKTREAWLEDNTTSWACMDTKLDMSCIPKTTIREEIWCITTYFLSVPSYYRRPFPSRVTLSSCFLVAHVLYSH